MVDTPQSRKAVRFGVFEMDLVAGQLRKNGLRVRLQEQPFQLLALLLERPGEVVTREELREKLWPADTFVEFDHSLNTAVKKLRRALGDSAESPRWIETLPRRGYRFLAPVEQVGELPDGALEGRDHTETTPGPRPAALIEPQVQQAIPSVDQSKRLLVAALLGLSGVAFAAVVGLLFRDSGSVQKPGRMRFTLNKPGLPQNLYMAASAAVSPDGNYVAYRDAAGSLWIHDLRLDERRKVAGRAENYFWSPDSSSLAFNHFWELTARVRTPIFGAGAILADWATVSRKSEN